MPTARISPGILSLQSALVVAGGVTSRGTYTAVVEIFKPDTKQWYTTNPLPTACDGVSLTTIDNTCYALGECKYPSYRIETLYASLDDLLHNAVPVTPTYETTAGIFMSVLYDVTFTNRTTPSRSRRGSSQSAWKTLPYIPASGSTATVLAGQLLAVGGVGIEADKPDVHIILLLYSPSTNSWIYTSDLPSPLSRAAVAVLSPIEILVIGGWDGGDCVNTVYKGTLQLKV